jgi:hypothetical protein
VKIGLAVVLVKAVVDEHNLGGCFQVVGYMSAEADSLGGFQVVGYTSAEVDSSGERAGIQVVGYTLVEVDSPVGTVVQQRRMEPGHLGMVNNYALEADAEEPGPLLDLDCISMNVPKPQNLAERPRFVVADMRANEG